MRNFLIGRIISIKFAVRGMILLLKTEHAVISQFSLSFLFLGLGLYFGINRYEWMIQTLLVGFILSIESLNTAVEKLCDFVHPDFHNKIGFIKDISAGAVSFAVFTSFIIAAIIYYPYLMHYF